MSIRPLSELPNREGFKFRGIRKDSGRYMNCRLKHLPGGMYICAAGEYVYKDVAPELAGWEPHPKRVEKPQTYSLAEIRNGTGWPRDARFMLVGAA